MKKAFSFFAVFLFVGLAQAQFRVGNGGEGILSQNEILVRDLVEYQVQPQFSTERSDYFEKKLKEKNFLSLTENQIILFANKMAAANQAHPYLGFQLLAVYKAYEWSLNPRALSLLPEAFARIHFPDEERVQLANRYLRSIMISRPAFKKMSDEQKVALILHELIYSMATVEWLPVNELVMYQNLASVRLVVAELMASADGRDFSKSLDLEKLLAIPREIVNPSCQNQSILRLEMISGEASELTVAIDSSEKEIFLLAQEACARTENFKHSLVKGVDLTQHFFPLNMNILIYPSTHGTDVAVAFGSYHPVTHKLLWPSSLENCATSFGKILANSLRTGMIPVEGVCQ